MGQKSSKVKTDRDRLCMLLIRGKGTKDHSIFEQLFSTVRSSTVEKE
jgi:hypothetical protein